MQGRGGAYLGRCQAEGSQVAWDIRLAGAVCDPPTLLAGKSSWKNHREESLQIKKKKKKRSHRIIVTQGNPGTLGKYFTLWATISSFAHKWGGETHYVVDPWIMQLKPPGSAAVWIFPSKYELQSCAICDCSNPWTRTWGYWGLTVKFSLDFRPCDRGGSVSLTPVLIKAQPCFQIQLKMNHPNLFPLSGAPLGLVQCSSFSVSQSG